MLINFTFKNCSKKVHLYCQICSSFELCSFLIVIVFSEVSSLTMWHVTWLELPTLVGARCCETTLIIVFALWILTPTSSSIGFLHCSQYSSRYMWQPTRNLECLATHTAALCVTHGKYSGYQLVIIIILVHKNTKVISRRLI